MNNVIFVSSVMLLIAAFGAVVHGNNDTKDSGVILDLHLIGDADGLTYYYENTTSRSWWDAWSYCQSNGMQLAAIITESQKEMLKSVSFPKNQYWTAGRDADEIRQFTWDQRNVAVPDLLKNNYKPMSVFRSCLYISKDGNYFDISSYNCNYSSDFFTLCST